MTDYGYGEYIVCAAGFAAVFCYPNNTWYYIAYYQSLHDYPEKMMRTNKGDLPVQINSEKAVDPRGKGGISKTHLYQLVMIFTISLTIAISMLVGAEVILSLKRTLEEYSAPGATVPPVSLQQAILAAQKDTRFEYAPFLLWKAMPHQRNGSIETNADGFRDTDHTIEKSNRYRIVLVGGSTVWSMGASATEHTITKQMERYLNTYLEKIDRTPCVEVLNFGQPGYVSAQELLLWRRILRYAPDMVIHYGPFNDVYAGYIGKTAGWNLPGINESALVSQRLPAIGDLLFSELLSYFEKLKLISWIKYQIQALPDSTPIDDVVNEYVTNISFVQSAASAHGIQLFIAFPPSLLTGKKPVTADEQRMLQAVHETRMGSLYFKTAYERIQSAISDANGKQSIPYTDITDAYMDVTDTIYLDHVHTWDEGYRIAAEALASFILGQTPDLCKR